MLAGLGVLRLSPQEFWSMTPRELAYALDGLRGITPASARPARGDLLALMRRFPDQ